MRSIFTHWCFLWVLLTTRAAWGQDAGRSIEFIENRGQWPTPARYAAQVGSGARLFVEDAGLTYALTTGLPGHGSEVAPRGPFRAHGLRVEFVQPNPGSHLTAENGTKTSSTRHYLRGADPARWAANVPAWHQLRYQQLWPGIDLVLRESDTQQLEYDLLLAAGADAAQVRLRYHGADGLRLDPATGRLLVATSAGQLTEYRPQAWQIDPANGQRRPVSCAFELVGTTVSFRLGAYDNRLPLTIDPVVQFASYTGSTVENWGFAATYDAAGNLYTAGVVFEPGYPTTTGAYQTTFGGNIDVAVMKFNANTTGPAARAWATYLGGSGLDFPHSLLVNGRGELLLLGTTSSANYPTTTTALSRVLKGGPAVSPFGGNSPFVLTGGADLVLTRLSASGGGLRASTYLGGTGTDGLLDAAAPMPRLRHNYGDAFRGDLALDPQGNVYVASVTSSTNFPGAGAYRGGTSDGLVTSLDSSFSQVRWTTLLGGSGADAAYSLQREDSGGLLVAGGTTSANLAGATNGYQATPGGDVDGFVTRLAVGGTLTQSTYLGTSGYDQAFFVRTGPTGQAYVLGQTLGSRWPGLDTTRYYQARGQQFIQQLAPDLRTAGFATVFGTGRTTTDISPTAFGLDCYGRLALAGWGGGLDPNGGNTVGLPVTSNALQANTDGQDFYLMQLSDGARALDYASFFGTSADDHVDGGTSRFDSQLTLYQAICACDQGRAITLPIPPGAYTYTGTNGAVRCNNAAFKLAFPAGPAAGAGDTLSICALALPLRLGGSPAGGTWAGPGVSGGAAAGFVFTPSTLLLGTQMLTYTSPAVVAGCAGTSTLRLTVLPQVAASLAAPTLQFCLLPGVTLTPVPLRGTPAGGIYSGRGVVNTAVGPVFDPQLAGAGIHTLWYVVNSGRCPARAPIVMLVERQIKPEVGPPQQVCANDPPLPLVGTPAGGVWTGVGVSNSAGIGYFTPSTALVGGPYQAIYTLPPGLACNATSDTLLVTVLPPGVTATVPPDTAVCVSGRPYRLRGGLPAGGSWSGPGVSGSVATGFFFTPAPQRVGANPLLYTGPPTATSAQCPGRVNRTILVNAGGQALLETAPIVCAVAGPQPLRALPVGGTWNGPGVSGSVAAGFVFTPTPALVGTQTLGYTGPQAANPTQCPAAGTIQVEVLAVPNVQIDPVGPINFCLTAPPHGVVLTATPVGGVFSGPGVVANRFNPATVGPGRYTITYTWSYPEFGLSCPIKATRTVEVNLVPVPVPIDTLLCTSGTVQLRSRPAGGVWTGPGITAGGLLTVPTTAGTFEVRYTLPDGCAPQLYRITVPAENSTIARWSAPLCAANHLAPYYVRFEATGSRASQVRWDFGDGSTATGAVVEHTYQAPGPYQPLASLPGPTGASGPCTDELTLPPLTVEAATVPNIITPNGDQLNDTFRPRIGGCVGRLQVFSRWGQKVFDTPAYQGDWAGAGLPVGVYYFLLDGGSAAVRVKGWVEIVR